MVKYRIAEVDDDEKINEFYNRIYQSNRTIEQFKWEFRKGPFGSSIYVIALDGDKIVGTNCVIPFELVFQDGRKIMSGKSEDTLVDPDYRGQRIFQNIYDFLFEKCKENGIEVIWGFTAAKKPFKKLGFQIPYDHEQTLAVNKIFKSYAHLSSLNSKNGFVEKFKIFGLCCYSKWSQVINFKKLRSVEVKKYVPEETSAADLLQECLEKNYECFGMLQSDEFQKWRIFDNPYYPQVESFSVFQNGRLVALFEANIQHGICFIVQSLFSPDLSNKEKSEVISSITKALFARGAVLIRNWVFDHTAINRNEKEVYKMANHIHLNRGIGFVWYNLGGVDIDPKHFYLSRLAAQGTN